MNHWILLPVLLPALLGSVLVLIGRRDPVIARTLSVASCAALLAETISRISREDSVSSLFIE